MIIDADCGVIDAKSRINYQQAVFDHLKRVQVWVTLMKTKSQSMRQPFLSITAKSAEQAELTMFGSVSEWSDLSAKEVKRKLAQIKSDGYKSVYCPMHCYGGSVYEGIAIRDVLKNSGLFIHIHVSGVAASMGSAILQGADKRTAHKFARIMIHEPSTWSSGNSKTLRQDADLLDTIKEDMAELYADACGKDKQWILDNWMKPDEDTWFNATKAKQYGLLDEVTSSNVEAPKSSMDFGKIAAFYDEQLNRDENQNQMTQAELAKKVGLPEDSSMEDIEAKIEQLEAASQGDGGEGGKDDPAAKIKTTLVNAAMALAKSKGMVNDTNEADIKAKIEKDPEAAIEWIDMVTPSKEEKKEAPKGGELSKLLAELKKSRSGEPKDKAWDDMSPKERAELEDKDPAAFKKVFDEKFKKQ
ncbi:head maturation protease, ClpP-related [Roseivirga sp. UBA1976]|uniref:head maturation protease, ClpP-related n=1 Tax=Roseivirga sp. UBA1976 TaxID=1947386 RepID=UPI00257EF3C8|nr:head maturation protease, ClpP-related [Roseivirga sp. UBA1976]